MPLVKNFVAGAFYSRSVANAQRKRLQSSHPRPLRVVSVWSFDSFIFYVVY